MSKNIVLRSKLNQTRIKADKTATISIATLNELDEDMFNQLNEYYFNNRDLLFIIVPREDYVHFLVEGGKRIINDSESELSH